ncbi:hypothetical protein [Lysinibacillus sp. BNK-21]|uniref:hypothetical protein n=1 Tax=Lysinibacillus sp. BNK-21 TaxID=3376156 RepID=UPI003B427DDA
MVKYVCEIHKIKLDSESYKINQFIKLINMNNMECVKVEAIYEVPFESNIYIFQKAIQLAIPNVNMEFKKNEIMESFNTYLNNYYGDSGNGYIEEDSSTVLIDSDRIEKIKTCFKILIEYNRNTKEAREKDDWTGTRWGYALQTYSSACSATTVDLSILSLITGFESLLVKGEGSLSYKVALYASLLVSNEKEERRKVYNLIKKMYNFRSKIVHGEIGSIVKLSKKEDIYRDYFELRSILSKLLIKTYGIPEEVLFTKIEDMIFECPSSNLN